MYKKYFYFYNMFYSIRQEINCKTINFSAFLLFFVNIVQFESQNIVYFFRKYFDLPLA